MHDGDLVRVKTGEHAGLIGELVGEPGTLGVAIKLTHSTNIITIPYPHGVMTADELLELMPQPQPSPSTLPPSHGRYDVASL